MKKLLLLLTLLFSFSAFAVDGKFTAPTARNNGAPLTVSEIAGYNVFINGVLDVGNLVASGATTFTVQANAGDAITLTCITLDGLESDPSNIFIVPVAEDLRSNEPIIIEITRPAFIIISPAAPE